MSFSFRLTGKLFTAESCICLYRGVDAEAMTTNHLFLTRGGRFAYLARVIGGKGVHAADEWGPDRAMRFLLQHGEGDIVDEFPDIFRKRPVAVATKARRPAAKDNAAEPMLFQMH